MKNNQYSQINYWAHMLDEAMNENGIPVISSIGEFLDLCKEKGEDVNKAKVKKQGKVVNATLADEDKKIKSREGTETAHKGDLVVDDGDDTFYAVNSKDISKYYELDKDGKSVTGDQTKWKKIAKELEYYVTPFDVDVKVQWQEKPLHATKGYALVCNDKDGKDISPVAPDVFNDKTLWLKESKTMKYSKKQIQEACEYYRRNASKFGGHKRVEEACAKWENEIDEGIGDFFGKLFNTKAYQKKTADEQYLKNHTLAAVAKAYGDGCTFAQAEFCNDGYPIDVSTDADVICFKEEPSKEKLEKAFKDAGHEDRKGDFTVKKLKGTYSLIPVSVKLPFGKFLDAPEY